MEVTHYSNCNSSVSPSILLGRTRYLEEGFGSSGSKMSSGPLLSIRPEEVTFAVELQKPAYCNVIVINNSKHYVAFMVKSTSPEKYFVRPNTSVLQPWDTCIIMVTLQAQKELPPDLECKDKFLIQSTKLPLHLVFEDTPPDLFNKDDKKVIEECKLRVSYVPLRSGIVKIEEELIDSIARDPHILKNPRAEEAQDLHRRREEPASTLQQNKLLHQEIEIPESCTIAFFGLIGLLIGILLTYALF